MRRLAFVLTVLLLSACATPEREQITEIVRIYQTATPQMTHRPGISATASLTLVATARPTSTPSSIPTAKAVVISGNPRGFQLLNPTPVYGAPCGLVDTFDFPLDPPDGDEASGGFGFGSYNNRYEKYHAGEDWGFRNQSNFGQNVQSIGHGQVTYAAPNGWGLDKGTVVVRHVFPWGGYVLSFYGHLDPPSVTLKTGDCVRRGDKVGEIGNPRTPPHLHFEIRYHLPSSAGHGYWSTDPAKAGWLPPSQTILETRMKASPGVSWTLPNAEGLTKPLGAYQGNYLFIHEGVIKAVDPLSGDISWQRTISESIRNGILGLQAGRITTGAEVPAEQVGEDQVYLFDLGGDLTAYRLGGSEEALWKADINAYSNVELIPLPGGGVVVADRRRATAVNADGQILWEEEIGSLPRSWVRIDNQVIFSSDDRLWTVDGSGTLGWDWPITGILTLSREMVYLYADDGIYVLNLGEKEGTRLMSLVSSDLDLGTMASTEKGDLILIHGDTYDRRLLLLDPEGELIWERSILELRRGQWQLCTEGEEVYLLVSYSTTSGSIADVYAIDLGSAELIHILQGGSRKSYTRNTWMQLMGDGLWLLNIGGGPIGAFNLQAAFERITDHQ